jgi:hypothetical protein
VRPVNGIREASSELNQVSESRLRQKVVALTIATRPRRTDSGNRGQAATTRTPWHLEFYLQNGEKIEHPPRGPKWHQPFSGGAAECRNQRLRRRNAGAGSQAWMPFGLPCRSGGTGAWHETVVNSPLRRESDTVAIGERVQGDRLTITVDFPSCKQNAGSIAPVGPDFANACFAESNKCQLKQR